MVYGIEPSAALAKALLCESATDLGLPGPDAVYGFGIVNAEEAMRLIDLHESSAASPFAEDIVSNGDVRTFSLIVPPGTPVFKTTVCWMDPAGNPAASKALVNDLDMLLIDPNGAMYYPYSLDPAAPAAPATNIGPNTVDPIEQTVVANPVSGTWTIQITGTSIPAGQQPFAVVANLTSVPQLPAAYIQASPTDGESPLSVSFDASGSLGNIVAYNWDFGDGTVGTGAMVEHTYTFTPQTASSQKFIATLTVTDTQNKASSASIEITVQKPSAALTPETIFGAVNLNLAGADFLRLKLSIPDLIHAPIAPGAIFTVRAGNGVDTQTLFAFTVNVHAVQRNRTERIEIDTRHGIVWLRFGNTAARNLISFYESLGITETTQALTTPFQVQVESNTLRYTAQFTLR